MQFCFLGTSVPLLKLSSWPSAEDLDLDDSQFRALQMALTNEFAVIQGPPGTGKTFIGLKVGLKVLRLMLLANAESWQGRELSTSTKCAGLSNPVSPYLCLADCQCLVA